MKFILLILLTFNVFSKEKTTQPKTIKKEKFDRGGLILPSDMLFRPYYLDKDNRILLANTERKNEKKPNISFSNKITVIKYNGVQYYESPKPKFEKGTCNKKKFWSTQIDYRKRSKENYNFLKKTKGEAGPSIVLSGHWKITNIETVQFKKKRKKLIDISKIKEFPIVVDHIFADKTDIKKGRSYKITEDLFRGNKKYYILKKDNGVIEQIITSLDAFKYGIYESKYLYAFPSGRDLGLYYYEKLTMKGVAGSTGKAFDQVDDGLYDEVQKRFLYSPFSNYYIRPYYFSSKGHTYLVLRHIDKIWEIKDGKLKLIDSGIKKLALELKSCKEWFNEFFTTPSSF